MQRPKILFTLIILITILIPAATVSAQPQQQFEDPIRQGEYIATIASCISCHTPRGQEGMLLAGGNSFNLGPLGEVYAGNLTPDEETGIGSWTDEEIKVAIQTGLSPDGLRHFPIMPNNIYANMAASDLDALVAYLRSIPPVSNQLPREQISSVASLPSIAISGATEPPNSTDHVTRGQYLFTSVIGCAECHTPIDSETGDTIPDAYLAGGQPYEGSWGIVYASNLTPHPQTGLGEWSDSDIERVLRSGIRPDGRRLVLMPWRDVAVLTEDDMTAVIAYLRTIPTVENEVPAPSLNEGFEEFVGLPTLAEEEPISPSNGTIGFILALIAVIGAVVTGVWMSRGSG